MVKSLIDPGKIGIINEISANGKSFFGVEEERLIGMNISEIMPSSLRKEHNGILEKWLEDPYINIINKPINAFCVNLQDKLLKARILFQLFEEEGELKLILGIIKLNERDYLAISEKGIIENFGLTFDEILP